MNFFKSKISLLFAGFIALSLVTSCSSDDNESENEQNSSIPSDSHASANPVLDKTNASIPNALFTSDKDIVNISLTGILNPQTHEWLNLQGTSQGNQNVWVEVDGIPKGILVYNNSADNTKGGPAVYADLVFLVDNSGSMNQEADSVASGIVRWATNLSNQGLNIQFGCVGYESGITGALGLSSLSEINNYLNRQYKRGTSRTKGYAGADSLKLLTNARQYQNGWDECGVEALRFADENFTFRAGANRIYVNFTDEPNQPGGSEKWSVEYVADQNNWNTSQGTIHTVFSEDSTYYTNSYKPLYNERPWLVSEYTGGTTKFVPSTFKNVSLEDLPVTGAMINSYIIKFKNTSIVENGKHEVKITVLSTDKQVKAQKVFKNVKFAE